MILFFRIMRFPYWRFSLITGPFRKNPAASNGGPPTASPAKRVAVGSEEIPCPAKRPRRKCGVQAFLPQAKILAQAEFISAEQF